MAGLGLGWNHEKASNMSTNNSVLVPRIESRIQVIRGVRVMIDVDLATRATQRLIVNVSGGSGFGKRLQT